MLKVVEIPEKYKKISAITVANFLAGKTSLTYTTEQGIALYIDMHKAVLLNFNLHDIKGLIELDQSVTSKYAIAMTFTDAVFIRHLIRLREDMLNKLNLASLSWILRPSYYLLLENGKQFSLPSMLTKYSAAARRDTITLSAGLWKYMWYYRIAFTLPSGTLTIKNTNGLKDMLISEFLFNGKTYKKNETIKVN